MKEYLIKLLCMPMFLFGYAIALYGQPSIHTDNDRLARSNFSGYTVEPSTGLMTYSIPFMSQKIGSNLSLTAGISYTSQGIKYDQRSGVVGLGWRLNLGGEIVRVKRGALHDEDGYGGNLLDTLIKSRADYYERLDEGHYDGENDLFIANFNSRSFKFLLVKNAQGAIEAHPLSQENDRINISSDTQGNIIAFEITDAMGCIYNFSEPEFIRIETERETARTFRYSHKWHLSRIRPADVDDEIKLSYRKSTNVDKQVKTDARLYVYGLPMSHPDVNNAYYQQQLTHYFSEFNAAKSTFTHQFEFLNGMMSNLQNSMRLKSHGGAFATSTLDLYLDQLAFQQMSGAMAQMNSHAHLQLSSALYYINYYYQLMYQSRVPVHTTYQNHFSTLYQEPLILTGLSWRGGGVSLEYDTFISDGISFDRLRKLKLLDNLKVPNYSVNFSYVDNNELLFDRTLTRTFLKTLTLSEMGRVDGEEFNFDYHLPVNNKRYDYDFWGFVKERTQPTGYGKGELEHSGITPIPFLGSIVPSERPPIHYGWYFEDAILPALEPNKMPVDFPGTSIRNPDAQAMNIFTLKEVDRTNGTLTSFIYEPNDITLEGRDGKLTGTEYLYEHEIKDHYNLIIGGLRIKSVLEMENNEEIDRTDYRYRFEGKNIFDRDYLISSAFLVSDHRTGYVDSLDFSEWGMTFRDFVIHESLLEPIGQLYMPGNNGIFYEYVEISKPGKGTTGYRYVPFKTVKDVDGRWCYPFWLENLLVAKTAYDDGRKLVQLERFKYAVADSDRLGVRGSQFDWFTNEGVRPYVHQEIQIKALNRQVFAHMEDGFPDDNIVIVELPNGGTVSYNPYHENWLPNFAPRLNVVSERPEYTIRYGGRVLLSETELLTFAEPISIQSVSHTLLGSVPKYPQYAYEWIVRQDVYKNISKIRSFRYDNPVHTFTTRTEDVGSDGSKIFTKQKYVADYIYGLSSVLDSMKMRNRIAETIETQIWRDLSGDIALIDAHLNEFRTVIDGAPTQHVAGVYRAHFPVPKSSSIMSSNEGYLSSPPYQNIFPSAGNHYNKELTLSWEREADGNIRLTDRFIHGTEKKEAFVYDAKGQILLTVPNIGRRAIAAFDKNMMSEFINSDRSNHSRYIRSYWSMYDLPADQIDWYNGIRFYLSQLDEIEQHQWDNPIFFGGEEIQDSIHFFARKALQSAMLSTDGYQLAHTIQEDIDAVFILNGIYEYMSIYQDNVTLYYSIANFLWMMLDYYSLDISGNFFTNSSYHQANSSVSHFKQLDVEPGQNSTTYRFIINQANNTGIMPVVQYRVKFTDGSSSSWQIFDPQTAIRRGKIWNLSLDLSSFSAVKTIQSLSVQVEQQASVLSAYLLPSEVSFNAFSYDSFGRQMSEISPRLNAIHTRYDGRGNVVSVTDENGDIIKGRVINVKSVQP